MSRAFNKGVVRSITGSLGRFLAIAVISALGCGFYAGLRMTAPDMQYAGDLFYDGTHASDIRVVSSLGLEDEDLARLAAVEGVEAVMPDREFDAIVTIDDVQNVVRFHGFDLAAAKASDTSDGVNAVSDDPGYINRAILVEGRWPETPDECLVGYDPVLEHRPELGGVIRILEGSSEVDIDDMVNMREFTVCGFIRTGYYPASTNTGSTSLGNGALDTFIYIANDAFMEDAPYAGAFITVEGARDLASSKQEYTDRVAEVMAALKESAPEFAAARLGDIKDDAQAELDDARSEYEEERADAEAQLADAQNELDDARSQLDEASSELEDARLQLDDAAREIEDGRREIADGWSAYDAGVAELADQRASLEAQLDEAQAKIDEQAAQLEAAKERLPEIEGGIALLEPEIAKATEGLAQLDAAIAQLEASDPQNPQLEVLRTSRAAAAEALAQATAQYETLVGQRNQIVAGEQALVTAQAELDAQRSLAEQGFADAQAELDAAAARLHEAEESLAQGIADYEQGRDEYYEGLSKYRDGVSSYRSGLSEYEDKRAEADEGFADAEAELADAQADIDALEEPEWYLLDRSKNVGVESFKADSNRIDRIARVFPFLFFLVAALVSLTTMTRMVEEERVLIGTFKALGYSTGRIMGKYLIYAFVACTVGAIVGIVALSLFLPYFIMEAYAIVYCVPPRPTLIDPGLSLLSGGLGVAITLAATIWAVASTLREQPASLMLPRVPKAGKRILLERIKPLWSRMGFLKKVTARNLFRYKRRFFMAIIGIAGCTALLLTGFGLNNAINDIIDKQWGELYHYQMIVHVKDDASSEDWAEIRSLVSDPRYASDNLELLSDNVIALEANGKEQRIDLLVPAEPERIDSYVTLRERKGHAPLTLSDDGVLVSEKLVSKLGLSVGDELVIYDQDLVGNAKGDGHAFIVAGVIEGYVGQQVYCTASCYERVMGEPAENQTLFVKSTDDPQLRQELATSLLAIDGVNTAGYNDDTIENYRTMLKSVNAVVVVLIVAAAALAFVVLYNLTNINITERLREIATLKVLGFTPGEVSAYIYRETMILSLIGAALGCILGIGMEAFVVTTAEVDQVMFGRDIHTLSFVVAFALTMVFSVVVAIAMRRKLDAIDMVESLKSIE